MSEEECSKCTNVVETALMLQCNHNLCLTCACVNFLREEKKYSALKLNAKYNSVKCDICGQVTSIDSETADQILLYKPEISVKMESASQSPRGVIKVIILIHRN